MDLHLKGLTAVVTGASSGIGAAIVNALLSEGCAVAFCSRDQSKVDAQLDYLHTIYPYAQVTGIALDVRDTHGCVRWLESLEQVDILIPCVSALSQDWNHAIEVDLASTINLIDIATPFIVRSSAGAITYIGTKATSLAENDSVAYGATKAAVNHYLKSLSLRLLPKVRVNTVSPGDTLTETGLWARVRQQAPSEFAKVVNRNPMQRLATPDEIAKVVTFISSPAASFVAGSNWYVDGGSTTHVQY